MKKRIIRIAVFFLLVISLFVFCGCASCERSFKSCNADISGGLCRTVNVYSLDGNSKLLSSTIEKIDTRFKWKATFYGERKIQYIIYNPGPVADRLRGDFANYYTALGFFGCP